MVTRQDSSDPTGVSSDNAKGRGTHAGAGNAARKRKADAALQMKTSGASWADIALTLGYPTPRQAMLACERALVLQLQDESKDRMRAMAGARLDRLLRGVWAKAIDPSNPDQMTAVSRARELTADWIKLYGLAAPTELVVTTPTQTELEDWVLRMTAAMVPDEEEGDIWDAEVVEEQEALGA